MASAGETTSRQGRRKQATKGKIVAAADALFAARGYDNTSIEEIAAEADIAVRTIYLHFESKAGIMLSYFDEWLDAFIDQVMRRPLSEPVVATVEAAVEAMSADGWLERVEQTGQRPHPLVQYLGSGSRDIAGHVMHRWMQKLHQLSTHDDAPNVDPHAATDRYARAMLIFSYWMGAMFVASEKEAGAELPKPLQGARPGSALLARITAGDL
ncbi:TetR/AcrR family transcriptional regulator [Nocardioides sp. Bht2]|uniref:TetR/AcrR family transcriptional regulator n=1 Tax=Nocardioides sp. Bht2 TaxID=3392297 RepID=UPI0039B43F6E